MEMLMPHNPDEHIIQLLGQNPPYIQRMREQLDAQVGDYARARRAGAETCQLVLDGYFGTDTHDAIRYQTQQVMLNAVGELPDVSVENDPRFGKTLVNLTAREDFTQEWAA